MSIYETIVKQLWRSFYFYFHLFHFYIFLYIHITSKVIWRNQRTRNNITIENWISYPLRVIFFCNCNIGKMTRKHKRQQFMSRFIIEVKVTNTFSSFFVFILFYLFFCKYKYTFFYKHYTHWIGFFFLAREIKQKENYQHNKNKKE